jgi:hypothetical protein
VSRPSALRNAIFPGWVLTSLVQKQIDARHFESEGAGAIARRRAAFAGICNAGTDWRADPASLFGGSRADPWRCAARRRRVGRAKAKEGQRCGPRNSKKSLHLSRTAPAS